MNYSAIRTITEGCFCQDLMLNNAVTKTNPENKDHEVAKNTLRVS